MYPLLKKLKVLLLLAFSFLSTATAQGPQTPCAPLPPPSWIDISNITYNSADASWEAVAPGAWYRVVLKNVETGLTVDSMITQSTYKTYYLPNGTFFELKIESSSCYKGAFGPPTLKSFGLPIIITDLIVNLNPIQDPKNIQPDQQDGPEFNYSPADNLIDAGELPFNICIYKSPDLQNIQHEQEVFHAYIQLENSDDFFEFLLLGDQQNKVHFSFPPLAYATGTAEWRMWCLRFGYVIGEPGQLTMFSTMKVQYRTDNNSNWEDKMIIDNASTLAVTDLHVPLAITVASDVDFYASDNLSGMCDEETPFKSNPTQHTTVGKIGPKIPVAPNPFTDHLNLNLSDFGDELTSVRILDATGRLQFEVNGAAAANEISRIETANWQTGIYYLHIQTETDVKVEPIIKL